ncbi:MAG: tripartite tricarboxylate transporter TctB family protein [Alphaproteobacteria bacterium]|nr:tripartite tricarboxylate transporter TctB family protein [Alphaproteobacteria bacterium]
MRRAQQIAGLAFLALALFLGWHATRLSYYSTLGPGPGFFPLWLCGILAVLALVVLVGTSRAAEAPQSFWPEREAWAPILAVIGGLIFVVLAMRSLGYVVTMLVFYLWLVVTLGNRNPLIIGVVALAGGLGTYAVFSRYLKQALPTGTLWM